MHCRECKCYLLPSIDLLDKIDCRFLNPFSFEISAIKEISMTAYALTIKGNPINASYAQNEHSNQLSR